MKVVAADRDLVVVHGHNGVLSVFSFTLSSSSSLSMFSTPWATTTTPKACNYDRLSLCSELDCIAVFNSWQSSSSASDVRSRVLIYTTKLALRAVITTSSVVDVMITPFGVVVATAMDVRKYDFCGNLLKSVEMGAGM